MKKLLKLILSIFVIQVHYAAGSSEDAMPTVSSGLMGSGEVTMMADALADATGRIPNGSAQDVTADEVINYLTWPVLDRQLQVTFSNLEGPIEISQQKIREAQQLLNRDGNLTIYRVLEALGLDLAYKQVCVGLATLKIGSPMAEILPHIGWEEVNVNISIVESFPVRLNPHVAISIKKNEIVKKAPGPSVTLTDPDAANEIRCNLISGAPLLPDLQATVVPVDRVELGGNSGQEIINIEKGAGRVTIVITRGEKELNRFIAWRMDHGIGIALTASFT